MYFWKISELEEDLKKGLSQKEDMKYLLAFVIIIGLAMIPMIQNPNGYDYALGLMGIFFMVGEVLLLYTYNKGEKGKNFLSRYLSVGFTVGVRSIVFLMTPLIILLIAGAAIFYPDYAGGTTGVADIIFSLLYFIGYLYMQIQSFKRINK